MREAGFTEQRVLPAPVLCCIPVHSNLYTKNYFKKKKKKKKKKEEEKNSFVYYITTSTF
jgi:hypothetical protein